MKAFTSRRVISISFAATLLLTGAATTRSAYVPQDGKKPIGFKSPSGYMPAPLSGHIGQMFLDPKRPAGIFVGYPKDGQDMNAFADEMKNMIVKMFLHNTQNPTWSSASLPPHKWSESESGTLMTTENDKMEVQLAFYSRPEGVAYGYFAMRHKKAKDDDAKFLDAKGSGVKALDEVSKSMMTN